MAERSDLRAARGTLAFVLSVLVTPPASPQSPLENRDTDPLSARLTLEHLLEVDLSDPFLVPEMADRDPVDDTEDAAATADAPWFRRSSLTLGFGRRMEDSGGEQGWTGSPDRALLRLDLRCTPSVSAGVTCEKDAGERLELGFLSGYLAVQDLPLRGAAVIGDYRVQAGCGLVLAGAANPIGIEETVRRIESNAPVLAPHRSREEFNFLRGLAVRVSPAVSPHLHCLLFFSRRRLPASGDDDAPALSTSALFRTAAEVRRRGRIRETVVGGRAEVGGGETVSCGVTLLQAWFSPQLVQGGPGTPAGSRWMILGADFAARAGPFRLKGEIARSPGGTGAVFLAAFAFGRSGLVAAGLQSLSSRFASYRFEGPVTSTASNETGLRLSARYDVSPSTQVRGYLCQHWTPSIAAGKTTLSAGWSGSIGGSTGLGRQWDLDWAFRARRGTDEASVVAPEGGKQKVLSFVGRSSARVSLRCRLGRRLESLTTVEEVRYSEGSGAGEETGEQLHEEIVWKPARWLVLSCAVTMYSADSYAARTTDLEDDPISRVRFASLQGEGFRWGCAVAVTAPVRGLTLLALLSGSDRSRPESDPLPGACGWGVRLRWKW